MTFDRLRRVTELFQEGTTVHLGQDEEGKPITVWVAKLNSFEVEEARRDGVAARAMQIEMLSRPDNDHRRVIDMLMSRWGDEELRQGRVEQQANEIFLKVMDDLEADPKWREKIEQVRRLPELLNDADAPEDDERRAELSRLNQEYLEEIEARNAKFRKEALQEIEHLERDELEKAYIAAWQDRMTLDDYIRERRQTEIFYALRDCSATETQGAGEARWSHSTCTHERLLATRAAVRDLPETVIEKVIAALEGTAVSERDAGNSGAPASSSESSERPGKDEEDSALSTPVETPSAVLTT